VKPENIIKLKHYMHNGLSIYQNKYCNITFLAMPRLSFTILNRPVVCKTTLLRQKSQQTYILLQNCKAHYCRIDAKAYQYLL